MIDLKRLRERVLADGALCGADVESLRRELESGNVGKDAVAFLLALRHEARQVSPSFERFFFEAVKRNVLTDGRLAADETRWLRRVLFADGRIDEEEKKFLRELRGEAAEVCREFHDLYDECMM